MGIKVGVIGLGVVGKRRFKIFKSATSVADVCFFDPTTKEYDTVSSVGTVDEIFNDTSIDAVAICTPNFQKLDLVSRALQSGKHVFCEKPPAISLADTLELQRISTTYPQVIVQFGFNHRYLSHYRKLKQTIVSREYGEPLWVRGMYGKGFDSSFFSGWRADPDQSGGGILLDQGIHMLDLILDLLGPLTVEHALIDTTKGVSPVDINSFIHLRSSQQVPVSVHSSMLQWRHKFCLEVGTDRAIIGIDGVKSSTRSYGEESIRIDSHWQNNFVESQTNKYSNPDYYTFKLECTDFIDAIENGSQPNEGSIHDAVRIMRLIDSIYSFS